MYQARYKTGDSRLRVVASEHPFDRAAVRGGERDIGEFGEEEPLVRRAEPRGNGRGENGERDAVMRERVGEEGERFGDWRLLEQRGEFPQAAPAGAGLLFEENAAAAHDPRAVFAHGDGFRAGLFDGEKFGVGGAALLAHGAEQALRFIRRAEQRAEFHEGGSVDASAGFREQVFGGLPQDRGSLGSVDGLVKIEQAREDAGDVRVDGGDGQIEGEAGDGSDGVASHAGESRDGGGVGGELAAVFGDNLFRGGVEIARARVVAESLPHAEHLGFRGGGEFGKIGEAREPLFVKRDDGRDLRLLEHDFGNHDRVRIVRAPPREIAPVLREPFGEARADLRGIFDFQIAMQARSFDGTRMAANEKPLTLYTSPLTPEQAAKLRAILVESGYKFEPKPYTLYYATKDKLNVAVYEKGPKVVLQGKGTEEFVTFRLEPEVLGAAKLGYEEENNPEMFAPHFGVDESGKGDFFGPLVIAGCYTDRGIAHTLMDAGVTDSKKIGSDRRIRELAETIRRTQGAVHSVIAIGPERYNEMYGKFKNLNRLLAWGHARIIENLLELRSDCPRALSDQFANPSLIQRALLEKGRGIVLEQRTKAESDVAVAAASILAREKFIDWLHKTGGQFQTELPRGASAQVKTAARALVAAHGPDVLLRVAKTHFKTASEIDPVRYPLVEKPPFVRRK